MATSTRFQKFERGDIRQHRESIWVGVLESAQLRMRVGFRWPLGAKLAELDRHIRQLGMHLIQLGMRILLGACGARPHLLLEAVDLGLEPEVAVGHVKVAAMGAYVHGPDVLVAPVEVALGVGKQVVSGRVARDTVLFPLLYFT